MNEETNLEKDWPPDPENDDLARLAEQLQDAAAPLPKEALLRVETQVHAELDRAAWRARWRRYALGWSVAAAILIAVVGYVVFRSGQENGRNPPLAQNNEPVLVEDRITIAVGSAGQAPAADKPLVRLDDFRSLFAD